MKSNLNLGVTISVDVGNCPAAKPLVQYLALYMQFLNRMDSEVATGGCLRWCRSRP